MSEWLIKKSMSEWIKIIEPCINVGVKKIHLVIIIQEVLDGERLRHSCLVEAITGHSPSRAVQQSGIRPVIE